MKKERIEISGIMPHSANVPQVVKYGNVYFFSAVRPVDAERRIPDDPEEQVNKAFDNLRALLDGCGLTFENVMKVRVYLTDMRLTGALNRVWAKHFDVETNPAARVVLGISEITSAGGSAIGTAISLDVTAIIDGDGTVLVAES
jgi:enamine deaminase RidA (YjgF/YER057c/UK114 family)